MAVSVRGLKWLSFPVLMYLDAYRCLSQRRVSRSITTDFESPNFASRDQKNLALKIRNVLRQIKRLRHHIMLYSAALMIPLPVPERMLSSARDWIKYRKRSLVKKIGDVTCCTTFISHSPPNTLPHSCGSLNVEGKIGNQASSCIGN